MAGKKMKDLAPKKTAVKGGRLVANDNATFVRAAKPVKDLAPKKTVVKGGKLVANDNVTLVRA